MTHEELTQAYNTLVETFVNYSEDAERARRENRMLRAVLMSKGMKPEDIERVVNPRPHVIGRAA